MSYQQLAFFMGFFGSLHCVAMCGPLVLALPTLNKSIGGVWLNRLRYQAGRVLTYGLLGLLVGLIGHAGSIKGWQQAMTLGTGVLLVGMGLFNLFGKYTPSFSRRQQQLVAPIARLMGHWLYRPGGSFIAGILNGLLPCGMVYMALAASLSADSIMSSAIFMMAFGLGTLPAMIGVSIAGAGLKWKFRLNIAKWLPLLFLVMGSWFLLRGANLDIPYLSPLIYPEGAITCK
ncbi:sulfite exporter TauE/SafE family protein [Parapedobacter lycopersici]|uniref:sulfite exporter TauE/SafE family protein n=1 Tax=Parapedobacter lycopersici TaxID=1864939 RepID=UPI00214D6991|nr:sulfite exporter TauE/SafE family protein [Parapedobacter lycopersici]